MKLRYIFPILLFAITGFFIYLYIYLGGYKNVDLKVSQESVFHTLYKDHLGAYHKIVPTIQEVETWAKSNGVDCTRSFGLYIDDPDTVEEIRLRSHGGCLVSEYPKNLPENFKTDDIPAKSYVIAIFDGAPSIGPMKVYPRAYQFAKEKGLQISGAVMEVYVVHSEKAVTTTYYFPLK